MLFIMPEELRNKLANLHIYASECIEIYTGPREYVASRLRTLLHPLLWATVAVGDVVCRTLLDYVGVPRICIVDGKTLRQSCSDYRKLVGFFDAVNVCRNPAGSISRECLEVLDSVSRDRRRHIIVVEGEEDLLTLAVAIVCQDVDLALYGVPRIGLAVVDMNCFRVKAINIFSRFTVSYRDTL